MTKSIALYIHWPFCVSKCPYCDFNSYQVANINQEDWNKALLKDLKWSLKEFAQGYKISTIFFGGGTPSIMPFNIVESIVNEVYKHGTSNKVIETTLETNPRTVNKEKLKSFKQAGINRLSLGVQSFLNKNLEFLKRDHDVKDTYKIIEDVKALFNNFSLDIIYGLKNQTISDLMHELKEIKKISPNHISAYQLTIEQNTPFYKQNIKETKDSLAIAMHSIIKSYLQGLGLYGYEVSNYAKKGYECKHNLNYWHGTPYIGIGPGACGRVLKQNTWHETMCTKLPTKYLKGVLKNSNSFEVYEKIEEKSRIEEIFLSYIRLNSGIPNNILNQLSKQQNANIATLVKEGFLTNSNNMLKCTKKGMFYINSIVEYVLA